MKMIKKLILSLMVLVLLTACSSPAEEKPGNGKTVDINEIAAAVEKALGENAVPGFALNEEEFKTMIGVDMKDVEKFVAKLPLMSTHVDTFIAVQAKAGKGENVEKALLANQKTIQENSLTYPMNIAKVSASKVVRYDDYVFFVMLGAFDERDEVTEAEALKFAQEENQKYLDIISSFFKD